MLGQVVDESFRILSLLGEGGIGEVYLGVQIAFERQVAIKFLRAYLTDDQEWQARFKREGQILASLQHANIVQCYASGAWHEKIPYLVFEYLEGKSLKEIITHRGRLPWRFALKVAREVCYALQYAHASSVIHRDLKPENILVMEEEPEPRLKVLDFGMSCFFDRGASVAETLTKTGELIGTVSYMSPEQCRGQKADQRADIYALGCIMYQAATGVLPFDGEAPVSIIYKHMNEQAPLPSSIVGEIPQTFDYVIMKALEKNRDDRYATATEMLNDIQKILQSETNLQLGEIAQDLSHNLQAQLGRRGNATNAQRRTAMFVGVFILICGLVLFTLSDPGPAVVLPFYASILPAEKRLSFFEKQGDSFLAKQRLAAAELLYGRAVKLLPVNDLDAELSLTSKLAQTALARNEKTKALRDASQCLQLADVNAVPMNDKNEKTILRACQIIEKLAPVGSTELVHALDWLREQSKPAEIIVSSTIAEQGLRCDDRLTVEKRAEQLVLALLKSEMEGRNDLIIRLVDSSQRRPDKALYCRHPLSFALISIKDEAEKGRLEPRTAWGVSNCIIQSILSERAGDEAERASLAHLFLAYFARLEFEWKLGHGKAEGLRLAMEKKSSYPLLSCEVAILESGFRTLKHELRAAVDASEYALRTLRTFKNMREKRRGEIFEAVGCIIGIMPDGAPQKKQLLVFFLDEMKAQTVRPNSAQLVSIAESFFDAPGKSSQRQIFLRLLDTARAEPDYDGVYFDELVKLARKAGKCGDKEAQQILNAVMKEDIGHANRRDIGSYYRYMVEQVSQSDPVAAKIYQSLAMESERLLQEHRLGKDD